LVLLKQTRSLAGSVIIDRVVHEPGDDGLFIGHGENLPEQGIVRITRDHASQVAARNQQRE
jgi:hypothetical protein